MIPLGVGLGFFLDGLTKVIQALVRDGDSLFAAVLAPCMVLAGLGVLLFLYNLMVANNGTLDVDIFRKDFHKILSLIIICAMLSGGGRMGRAMGIFTYAFGVGVNNAIKTSIATTGDVENTLRQASAGEAAQEAARNQLKTCSAIPQLSADGTPNPAYADCGKAVIANIQKNNLGTEQQRAALTPTSPLEAAGKVIGGVFDGVGEALMSIPKAIFNGAQESVAMIGYMSMVLMIAFLPIPLALATLDSAMLKAWFASMFGCALFMACNTIFQGIYIIATATQGPSASIYTAGIILGIFCPILAGVVSGLTAKTLFGLIAGGVRTAATAASSGALGPR